jgi:hypothetical protein
MPGTLVIAEARQGELREVSFELIGAAQQIKSQVGGPLAVAHGWWGPARDVAGLRGAPAVHRVVHRPQQQRHRAAAGPVGHDHAEAPAVQVDGGELVPDERGDLAVVEDAGRPADPGCLCCRPARGYRPRHRFLHVALCPAPPRRRNGGRLPRGGPGRRLGGMITPADAEPARRCPR